MDTKDVQGAPLEVGDWIITDGLTVGVVRKLPENFRGKGSQLLVTTGGHYFNEHSPILYRYGLSIRRSTTHGYMCWKVLKVPGIWDLCDPRWIPLLEEERTKCLT